MWSLENQSQPTSFGLVPGHMFLSSKNRSHREWTWVHKIDQNRVPDYWRFNGQRMLIPGIFILWKMLAKHSKLTHFSKQNTPSLAFNNKEVDNNKKEPGKHSLQAKKIFLWHCPNLFFSSLHVLVPNRNSDIHVNAELRLAHGCNWSLAHPLVCLYK